jgi:O-antigen/teichoic acid export membrane protein
MYLNVTYPVLAKVENESDLLRVYRKMNRVLAFILFPLTALAVLCASGFVTVILGAKWEPAIPVIQLLALGGMFITFRGFSWNILKIKKKTNFILFNEIIYSVLMFGGLFAGVFLQWSLNAIVGCIGLAHAVGYAVNYFYIRHLINYQLRSHIADLLPYFGISALAFGAAWLFTLIIDVPVWLLVVQIAVFAGVYLSTAYFAGSAIFREVMSLVKRHFLGKK